MNVRRWLLAAALGAGAAALAAAPAAQAAPDTSAPNPPFVSFNGLPPEINSVRIFAGAGSGPLLSAASAWAGLADELKAASQSFDDVLKQVPKPAVPSDSLIDTGSWLTPGEPATRSGVYDPVPEPKPRPANNSDRVDD